MGKLRKWKITYITNDYRLEIMYFNARSLYEAANYVGGHVVNERVVSIVEELEL